MATPSRENFAEWEECISAPLGTAALEIFKIATKKNEPFLLSDAITFVESFYKELDERLCDLGKLEISIWLISQAGWSRATNIILPKKINKSQSKSQIIENRAAWIIELNTTETILRRAKVFIKNREPVNSWRGELVGALSNYLYADHEGIFNSQKNIRKNCEEIKDRLKEMKAFLEVWEIDFSDRAEHIIRRIDKWKDYVSLGVLRNQTNKAEHSFIKDLWTINMVKFRSAKPNVIAEVMTFDCFARQFDPRSISRICSALNKAK